MKALLFSFWLLETVVLSVLTVFLWQALFRELPTYGGLEALVMVLATLLATVCTVSVSILLFVIWRDVG